MRTLHFAFALLLSCFTVAQAQDIPTPPTGSEKGPAPKNYTANNLVVEATAQPLAKPTSPVMAVEYDDLHRIAIGATLQQVDVPHPGIAGQRVTIRFYAPNVRPRIREYSSRIVYDYGWHRVEVKYRRGRIVVDYDGPSRGPRFGIAVGYFSYRRW